MEDWEEFVGKRIKLIYDDGGDHPSKKVGVLKKGTPTHLILEVDGKIQAILLTKILRVEVCR